jgi:hypothetical protein
MGIVAICTYRPKPGRERDFLAFFNYLMRLVLEFVLF